MVAGVHNRSTDRRTATQVTRTSSFTNTAVLVVNIADLTNGSHAEDVHPALLTRRQTHLGVVALFRHQLRASSGSAHHLAAATLRQLDVVNHGTSWNILQRQCIARLDVRLRPSYHLVANLQPQRSQNITLLTIQIVQQRNTSRTI